MSYFSNQEHETSYSILHKSLTQHNSQSFLIIHTHTPTLNLSKLPQIIAALKVRAGILKIGWTLRQQRP